MAEQAFRHRTSGGLSVADSLGMSVSSQLGATPKASQVSLGLVVAEAFAVAGEAVLHRACGEALELLAAPSQPAAAPEASLAVAEEAANAETPGTPARSQPAVAPEASLPVADEAANAEAPETPAPSQHGAAPEASLHAEAPGTPASRQPAAAQDPCGGLKFGVFAASSDTITTHLRETLDHELIVMESVVANLESQPGQSLPAAAPTYPVDLGPDSPVEELETEAVEKKSESLSEVKPLSPRGSEVREGPQVGAAQWGMAITRSASRSLRNIVNGVSDVELWQLFQNASQPAQDARPASPRTDAASSGSPPKGSSAPASSGPSEVKTEQVKNEIEPASGGSPRKVMRTTGTFLLADLVKRAAAAHPVAPSVATGDWVAGMEVNAEEADWGKPADDDAEEGSSNYTAR